MALDSIGIHEEGVSSTTLVPSVEVGTRRTVGGIDYLYVYNVAANSQISKGKFARIPADDLDAVYSCTVTNAASQSGGLAVVGVAHNATFATGAYGWLAVRGQVYVALDGSEVSMNSGDVLAAGVDGGFVVAPATLSTGIHLGLAVNSLVTTVGTGKAMFKSPLFG